MNLNTDLIEFRLFINRKFVKTQHGFLEHFTKTLVIFLLKKSYQNETKCYHETVNTPNFSTDIVVI